MGSGENDLGSGDILTIRTSGVSYGLNMRCDRKKGYKDISTLWPEQERLGSYD